MEPIDPNDHGPVEADGSWAGAPHPAAYPQAFGQSQYAYPPMPGAGSPYPLQPYGPVPYGQQPGLVPTLAPSPPRSQRRLIITLTLVAALVLTGIGIVVANSGTSTPSAGAPLPIPTSVGSFNQRTDAILDRYRNSFQREVASIHGELARFFTKGQLAVYTSDSGNFGATLVMLVGRASAYPNIASAGITGQAFGTFSNPMPFDAGDHGGALQCADAPAANDQESICVWSDSTSVGFLIAVNTTLTLNDVADRTNEARATIDS